MRPIALVFLLSVAGIWNFASAQVDFSETDIQEKIVELRNEFLADPANKGKDANGNKLLTDLLFDIVEGITRVDIANNKPINANRVKILDDFFAPILFPGGVDVNAFLLGNVGLDAAEEAAVDATAPLLSLILVENDKLPHGPNVFCTANSQCVGNRLQNREVSVNRTCIDNGPENPALCDSFVGFFTIQWLFVFTMGMWFILIVWFVYTVVIPRLKKLLRKKKEKEEQKPKALASDDQLILNTLASQCATAENLLFRATEIMKYVKNQEQIVTVETRRETKLLRVTAEYFQTLAAITTVLTHKYLDRKLQPGERLSSCIDDLTTRALQLEVLRYVKERLNLAMDSEPFSENSLVRLGEAYVILKRVMSNISLVGVEWSVGDEKLKFVRTPQPEIDENAFFLSGIYSASGDMRGDSRLDGQEVCITINGADNHGVRTNLPANYYLANSTVSVWNFDRDSRSVESGRGKALVFNFNNAGARGDTLKYFARQLWGQEISNIQDIAVKDWLKKDDGLERFLDNERVETEEAVLPYLKKGKGKRKVFDDDMSSAYTEESGFTVKSKGAKNIYNARTVVNLGLSIAGKGGIPFDSKGDDSTEKKSIWKRVAEYFPNAAEWPKFYLIVFVIMPIAIAIPMLSKIGQGASAIDIDGNVAFVARPAGFGTSFLGVQIYYFLDGFIPNVDDLVAADAKDDPNKLATVLDFAGINNPPDGAEFPKDGKVFISNVDAQKNLVQFNGLFGRLPDFFLAEIQAGILAQKSAADLATAQEQQEAQKVLTTVIYSFMHIGVYFFAILPFTLCRESWEILARKFPSIRQVLPLGLWRDLHMTIGLSVILYVTFGATVFVVTSLISMGRSTPFSGFAGDPNIADFFDLDANVLYLRQLLLPAVPLLLLMKYADRGPPRFMVRFFPTFITKWYFEMCYFFHFFVAITTIVMLVLYRPQVFYWVGASWGFGYGLNKIVRIVRTKKTTIANAELISYTVEDKRNNAKKKTQVLRLSLNVPKSFPNSSRGQAVWLIAPNLDFVSHPFTIAKVPDSDKNDQTITLHMGIKYMAGDDVLSYAKPEYTKSVPTKEPVLDDGRLPVGWKQAVDPESGQTYYYNSAMRRTSWTRPKENNFRALTTRFSTALGYRGSTIYDMTNGTMGDNTVRGIQINHRSTWTQKMAALTQRIQTLDADLKENKLKEFPVYVSAPLGTSFDDVLQPSLPGSVIIATQNGLPAAEASVRWLLSKRKRERPKFFYFVSVAREVNDALTIIETLRNSVCEAVESGNINIDALDAKHSHMCDWLGVTINLTQRKGSQIEGDRDMLLRSLNPPKANVTPEQLEVIETWLKNRVSPGRLNFGRYLKRVSEQVQSRTGSDRVAVGYCGSSLVAGAIRSAARDVKNMTFQGEYI